MWASYPTFLKCFLTGNVVTKTQPRSRPVCRFKATMPAERIASAQQTAVLAMSPCLPGSPSLLKSRRLLHRVLSLCPAGPCQHTRHRGDLLQWFWVSLEALCICAHCQKVRNYLPSHMPLKHPKHNRLRWWAVSRCATRQPCKARAAAGRAGAGSGRECWASSLACAQKMPLGSKVANHIPWLRTQEGSWQRARPRSWWAEAQAPGLQAGPDPSKRHPHHLSLPGLCLRALKGQRPGSEGQLLGLLV